MTTEIKSLSLYHTDFCLWLETTANLLKKGQFDQIDRKDLLEEIESMGRSERLALRSNLRVLLVHLLKWKYQPSKRSNRWQSSITEHCLRILEAFQESPSLKRYFIEVFEEIYQNARLLAQKETGLSKETFPEICPFTVENILYPEYLPEDS